MENRPEHERLFDEICGKLNELSQKGDNLEDSAWSGQLEKMQSQLRKSQDELRMAQTEIQEKIRNFDNIPVPQGDIQSEMRKLSDQLDQERSTNSRLSADLGKSLELNLKLQFEIEEVKSKANQIINEERKHNHYLNEKVKNLNHEMELVQALNSEIRSELVKAKEKFHIDNDNLKTENEELKATSQQQKDVLEQQNLRLKEIESLLEQKQHEIKSITDSLKEFEAHSMQQSEALKNLSAVAEKKIVELKVALDRKNVESQDYYSHLQQALAQAAILKQENAALKEYIAKISQLQGPMQSHSGKQTEVRA